MKVIVTVYRDNDTTTPFGKLPLSVQDVDYISDLVEDIDEFLEEQFYAIEEDEDE